MRVEVCCPRKKVRGRQQVVSESGLCGLHRLRSSFLRQDDVLYWAGSIAILPMNGANPSIPQGRLSKEQGVQECDATNDDSSNKPGQQK